MLAYWFTYIPSIRKNEILNENIKLYIRTRGSEYKGMYRSPGQENLLDHSLPIVAYVKF
jgi:hypothetical protein